MTRSRLSLTAFSSVLQVDRLAIPDHAGLHPGSLTGLHANSRILEYQTGRRFKS
ncbi:hypothetical protein [Aeromonas salmonicida]|uniref:hypothetical protein n=1 Tax=Aeromonas salmonicida TaxID=645 RepID=UPI0035A28E88